MACVGDPATRRLLHRRLLRRWLLRRSPGTLSLLALLPRRCAANKSVAPLVFEANPNHCRVALQKLDGQRQVWHSARHQVGARHAVVLERQHVPRTAASPAEPDVVDRAEEAFVGGIPMSNLELRAACQELRMVFRIAAIVHPHELVAQVAADGCLRLQVRDSGRIGVREIRGA